MKRNRLLSLGSPRGPSGINTLHVTHIDFDIEGAEIAYTANNNMRFQAINALDAANPGLVVSVTIPSFPTGPDSDGDRRDLHRGERLHPGQLRQGERPREAGVLVGGQGPAVRRQRQRPVPVLG
ncbi:MAG TPA: hypothetical protein VGG25_22630, partial [Streptosporangiaceae bacterium]